MTLAQGPSYERTNTVVENPTPAVPVQQLPPNEQFTETVVPAHARQVQTSSASRFAPDALIAAGVGLVLLVIGLIAMVRGGFTGPMSDPVVNVLGFTHTTTLGFIEIGLGICLLAAGATQSRSGALFFGGVLGVGGFVGAVQTKSFVHTLALESSMAWLAVVAGAVVVLAALLLPRFATRSNSITQN